MVYNKGFTKYPGSDSNSRQYLGKDLSCIGCRDVAYLLRCA